MPSQRRMTRRDLLVLGAGVSLAAGGCTSSGSAPPHRTSPASDRPTTHPRHPVASPTRTTALPAPVAWMPNANDVDPVVKQRAVRLIEAIGTWTDGASGRRAARQRIVALGEDPHLLTRGRPLLGEYPEAVVSVIDAQYGGILATSASVLVICRQLVRTPQGGVLHRGTTVDVRLAKVRTRWGVTTMFPARPGAPAPGLPHEARQVLDNPRITLPPASEADIRSGRVHSSVMSALLQLANNYRIDVSVVRSGHPLHVFGTDRLSDHPRGRAFDTWRINGREVVDRRTPETLVVGYMHAAAAAGSYNVGGPYLVAGSGDQFFSDNTHHDHVHAGFLT
ncbi:MAG: hypothetical protein ACRDPG_08050 [Nocardioidaceae bacterium]